MIKEFSLSKTERVRIWINENPGSKYRSTEILASRIAANPSDHGCTFIALECLIITGPRKLYGLLGAQFEPTKSDFCEIEVKISSDAGESVIWSLIGETDRVLKGLPAEYASAVLEGALKYPSPHSGRIVFDNACHAVMGSSQNLFSNISLAVVDLLFSAVSSNDEELIETAKKNLSITRDHARRM